MEHFPENLALVLKLLSISSTALAARLETDKSVVSRWLRGSVKPSAYNLSKLTAIVAEHVEGFRTLDWERAPDGLAQIFGVESRPTEPASIGGPPLGVWKQLLGAAKARASAYEGIYQCTRPHPMAPGRFLLEDVLIQRDPIGLLAMTMSSSEIYLRGWLMPLQGLVYGIGSDPITGSMMFAIFNGVGAPRVDVLDGLLLLPGADMGRSPSAMAMVCERVAEVTGDQDADWKTFERLRRRNPLAPPGSIPEDIQRHLVRDFGPSHIADGDWLLSMTLARTLSRGRDWDSVGEPDPQA